MNWRLIDTGINTGSYNMQFDLNLAKDVKPESAMLRLYRWSPYCISLGANQDIKEINSEKAAADGIDIVKRPTGGRAILHSEELTYSVVMYLESGSSPRNIYEQINFALIEGLKLYNPELNQLELEGHQPNLPSFYKENIGAACFGVPAKSEIKFAGKKLVGSAQRKLGSVLLQHGSIMCGDFHVNLAEYLNLNKNESDSVKKELNNKTTELESILNIETDYDQLAISIAEGFENFFRVQLFREELISHNDL